MGDSTEANAKLIEVDAPKNGGYELPVAVCDNFPAITLPTEWAQKIIARIVRNKRGLLNAFPHLRPENGNDIKQEMFMAVGNAWRGFDLSKVASTFVGNVVSRKIIDIYRRADAQRKNEQKYHRLRGESYTDGPTEAPKDATLAEWLAGICLECRRQFPDKQWTGKGKFKYSLDQAAGIAALMTRLKLSDRACRSMLIEFPELRRALRLKAAPSRAMIAACLGRLDRVLKPSRN